MKQKQLLALISTMLVLVMLVGTAVYAEDISGEASTQQQTPQQEVKKSDGFSAVPANMRGAVKVKKGQIFKEPSTKSSVLLTLSFGKKVNTRKTKGDWYYVTYTKSGKTYSGYMTKNHVVMYDKTKKHIALTFDDGPIKGRTNIVLNALEKNKCRATFFVVGRNITGKTKKLIKRQKKLGCEIGNHSFTHPKLTGLGASGTKKELAKTDKKVKAITGSKTTICRAPYGARNNVVVKAMGRPHIMWSVDTVDWRYRNTKRLISYVKKHKRDGAIILMHDIHLSTDKAVNAICKDLKKKNYETVTVTELAAINGKKFKAGKTYFNMYK